MPDSRPLPTLPLDAWHPTESPGGGSPRTRLLRAGGGAQADGSPCPARARGEARSPDGEPRHVGRRHNGSGSPRSVAGQSSVQLVAVVPALLFAALVALQLVLLGGALWSAGIAARAGARAAHVGGVPSEVALNALPAMLRSGASVRSGRRGIRVRVEVPTLVPGLPRVPLVAHTALAPEAEGG